MGSNHLPLAELWDIVHESLDKLWKVISGDLKGGYPAGEYSMVYSHVHNFLCWATVGEEGEARDSQSAKAAIAARLGRWLRHHMQTHSVPAIKEAIERSSVFEELVKQWDQHKLLTRWLLKLFDYLDKIYLKGREVSAIAEGAPDLRTGCMLLFEKSIFSSVQNEVVTAMLEAIAAERRGERTNRNSLKSAVEVLVEVGCVTGVDPKRKTYFVDDSTKYRVYITSFEQPLLEATENFYQVASQQWLTEDSASEYLTKAEAHILDEEDRADVYLHSRTRAPLLRVVEKCLLEDHLDTLLLQENTGFVSMMEYHDLDNLALMFRMFRRLSDEKLVQMSSLFNHCIEIEGGNILSKLSDSNADSHAIMVELLTLQNKHLSILQDQFKNDVLFQRALEQATSKFINCEVSYRGSFELPAVLLSSFCSVMLSRNKDKYTSAPLEDVLDSVCLMLKSLHDKDLFFSNYRNDLATRLLDPKLTNESEERMALSKFKSSFHGIVSRLETMLQDRETSIENLKRFKAWTKDKKRGKPLPIKDFAVFVLTCSVWPSYSIDSMTPPEDVNVCQQLFTQFYAEFAKNRILQWVHSETKATLEAFFSRGKRKLVMTGYQACVCLLFNQHPGPLSVQQISEHLHLDLKLVKPAVVGLTGGKKKILLRSGEGKRLRDDEQVTFNKDIKLDKSLVWKIPLPRVTETSRSARSSDIRSVKVARDSMLDAAVVRVMKERRSLHHQQLMAEVMAQIKLFRPEPRTIKARIEDLIVREFLIRDETNPQLYKYLA